MRKGTYHIPGSAFPALMERLLNVAKEQAPPDHWHARSYGGPKAELTVPELEAIST
jgi:hypothetical protein